MRIMGFDCFGIGTAEGTNGESKRTQKGNFALLRSFVQRITISVK